MLMSGMMGMQVVGRSDGEGFGMGMGMMGGRVKGGAAWYAQARYNGADGW